MQVSRVDWIEAGLELVGWVGVAGIKIDDLARRLGVTKGSFYWHFKDRDDFLESIVKTWEDDSRELFRGVDDEPDPRRRLTLIHELVAARVGHRKGRFPDHAMFTWAHHDRKVAERVAVIEQERLQIISRIFRGIGLPAGEAEFRALTYYLATTSWLEREHRCPQILPRYEVFGRRLHETLTSGELPAAAPGRRSRPEKKGRRPARKAAPK